MMFIYATQSNSDRLFSTQSKVQQADWMILGNSEKSASHVILKSPIDLIHSYFLFFITQLQVIIHTIYQPVRNLSDNVLAGIEQVMAWSDTNNMILNNDKTLILNVAF